MQVSRILRVLTISAGLLPALAVAQTPAIPTPSRASPKLLVKAGLRLTHLFYLPDGRTWQLILPASFGVEYRFQPRFSLYAQAEADISTGRAGRGRRNAPTLLTPSTNLSLGARYYFNQPRADTARGPEAWGNYIALETTAELTQINLRGRGRGRGSARITPGVFALCGTQHRGPGRRLLYDLNAGIGIQVPPPYAAEAAIKRPWDVAGQVNLRVYLVNQGRNAKPRRH